MYIGRKILELTFRGRNIDWRGDICRRGTVKNQARSGLDALH